MKKKLTKDGRKPRTKLKCYDPRRRQRDNDSRALPIEERIPEALLNVLLAAKKQFGIMPYEVAERTGIDRRTINDFFSKGRYMSFAQYDEIYKAMRDIILEHMGLTAQEAMQKIAKMKQCQHSGFSSGESPQRK